MREEFGNAVKGAARFRMISAVLMIIFGCLALFMPGLTGMAASMIFGWIILLAGLVHVAYAFTAGGVGSFLWRVLIAVIYVLGGLYLLTNPGLALGGLTLAIAAIFFVEGVSQIIAFFSSRGMPGASWLLIDGVISIALGALIWENWPSSSAWVIGTLIGINLVISGITRLMAAAALKRIAAMA